MSFGIAIYDENQKIIFEEGVRYLRIIGSYSVPAVLNVTESGLVYTFQLPSSVPTNETPIAFGTLLNPPDVVDIVGRSVNVTRRGSFRSWNENVGSIYNGAACTVYYGFFA